MENVHFYFPLFDHFYIDIYICNTLRKLLCMSDEGYQTFLIDLEDYKSELEEGE